MCQVWERRAKRTYAGADERRALVRAAERFKLCRLFGKGNARSGLYILTEMEHRAALAVMPPAKPEAEPEPPAESIEFEINVTHTPKKCPRKSVEGSIMKVHYVGKIIKTKKIFASSFHTGTSPHLERRSVFATAPRSVRSTRDAAHASGLQAPCRSDSHWAVTRSSTRGIRASSGCARASAAA